ncbi:uncharacterized protein THITE_2118276 [Thermothielavioides terrestris NRRL 8126]|uniref:AB hydrolase-1 domain-containing protein n=2 Tax=Thermothielavioides terrestris TaxID=2587410 RepID=G2R9F6_THETT|nr:uncharacterized protein THITE_2118276 [Thermothielavioides terrestris NRRL 8126]AEO68697.1 hypothetical protein THITE_2118276 [Thermothielavioides terrestris NRRL 8126]
MRGHGRSGHGAVARGGFHVARLAADLREVLRFLKRSAAASPTAAYVSGPGPESGAAAAGGGGGEVKFVLVGCSIGAAVLWTHIELFGEDLDGDGCCAGYVFVDQAPLQDRAGPLGLGGAWDARHAHRGCFDEASLFAAQEAWVRRPAETHRALVAECLGYRVQPREGDAVGEEQARRDEEFFVAISARCDGVWLARLLADHTRYDHREALEGITRPTLVMAGRRSGCFPLEGVAETAERIRKGGNQQVEMLVFESGHWLFYEEPERFNRELLRFVDMCTR